MLKQSILDAYNSKLSELTRLGQELHSLLEQLLERADIKVHEVSFRIKTLDSLSKKVARPDKIYESLEDITDVVGLRVITYFEDEIEAVARTVENRFDIDVERSIDKRLHSDPQSFGYRSLHYVCRLRGGEPDGGQGSWAFEIQIRSILQHAWAEIEHDLGYKYPESIPQPVRRRFSRLAGLLEIADEEFVGLRRTMEAYERSVRRPDRDEAIEWDAVSLRNLIEEPLVAELDAAIAGSLGKPLSSTLFFPDYLVRMLRCTKLEHPRHVRLLLEQEGKQLLGFVPLYFTFTREAWGFHGQDFESLQRGYSIFLLAHAQVFREAELDIHRGERMKAFYQHLDYPHQEDEAWRVARLFVKIFADWKPQG